MLKSIRVLEGELADYNLAVDKMRSGVKPEELLQQAMVLKAANEKKPLSWTASTSRPRKSKPP